MIAYREDAFKLHVVKVFIILVLVVFNDFGKHLLRFFLELCNFCSLFLKRGIGLRNTK